MCVAPQAPSVASAPLPLNLAPVASAPAAPTAAAAEVMEVNAAVAALREQLSALQANADASRANMIKLNLREAEEILRG